MQSVRNVLLGKVLWEAPFGPQYSSEPQRYINLRCVVWQSEIVSVFNALCNDISTCDTSVCVAPPLGSV
jgi:hypothetical protein